MAKIVVAGGGVVGLTTAMLLAREGHSVTVLERDAAPPPSDTEEAWEDWDRQGVNQFRMLHFFLPRWRQIMERELPEVIEGAIAAGALVANPVEGAPDALTGGPREGDEAFRIVTGRRPVFEAVIARTAAADPNIEVRRGVAVDGLLTGPSAIDGVPHVTGVRTNEGEELPADLVVDMTGRRSPLPRWLEAIGAKPPQEELEDSGFMYYGRHFRSGDGSIPVALGGLLQAYGSVSVLTLPGDNGTWGVGIIASAKDAALRKLKDVDTWMRTMRGFPLLAHWVDGEPLDEGVAVMAKIEDRIRRYVVDGVPVATGVVSVADSWACTNPSLGRGMTMGTMHALALRDTLRDTGFEDPAKLVLAFDEATESTMVPWYRATNHFDRHRLAEIDAACAGEAYIPGDPVWEMTKALEFMAMRGNPDVLRAYLSVVGLLRPGDEAVTLPGVFELITGEGANWRDEPLPGPNREELLALVNG